MCSSQRINSLVDRVVAKSWVNQRQHNARANTVIEGCVSPTWTPEIISLCKVKRRELLCSDSRVALATFMKVIIL